MTASVHDQIVQNQNMTNAQKAAQSTGVKESSSSVNSQDFLYLLTQQLQYQDPMNPMDNSEMLAQEAQFATLEQMEALTSSFSEFSSIYQANSLLGQNVEVSVDGKETSGKVEYVDFSDTSGASVSINGNMYPLSSVTKVYPEDVVSTNDDTNFFKAAAESVAANVYNIANKLVGYENNNSTDSTTNSTNDSATTN
ncbi:hypothetical protein IJX73_00680 [bacterium]|nr:hypothetical protein [bacterium]MBQ9149424.1 hypothetical protein [bacterium]